MSRQIADPSADLSVVVVTYNSEAVVTNCLNSVISALPRAEVIVVDNGSTDETLALAARYDVSFVTGQGNVGFGVGVNLGVAAATRTILLVLNPDTVLLHHDPTALAALVGKSTVGLLGCRIREGGRERFHITSFWPWRLELLWSLARWFLMPRELSVPRPSPLAGRSRRWVKGAAFVVRVSEFRQTGGFDPGFFLYFEDADLARTYCERGLPVGTTDAVTVIHAAQKSSPRNEELMISFALLGLLQFVSKWEGAAEATRAAASSLRLLDLVVRSGAALRRMPVLGPRSSKKSLAAANVRAALVASLVSPPREASYEGARNALRAALSRPV